MSLTIEQYAVKPRAVEAVRLTPSNAEMAAQWARGRCWVEESLFEDDATVTYVTVETVPGVMETGRADGSTWLVKANEGWRIMGDKAFNHTYIQAKRVVLV